MIRLILKDRGQITIPARIRKQLTLNSGDILKLEVKEGYIVLKLLDVVERQAEVLERPPGGPPE